MSTIKELEARLNKSYEAPQDGLEIETISMELIVALLREDVPQATHLMLDWGDQGPHHDLADILAADGTSLLTEIEGTDAEDVVTYVTNLRGALHDRFEPVNPDGGVYRVELSRFSPEGNAMGNNKIENITQLEEFAKNATDFHYSEHGTKANAMWAGNTLAHYGRLIGHGDLPSYELDTIMSDLLGDLLHLAKFLKVDFDEALEKAQDNFFAEEEEQEVRFGDWTPLPGEDPDALV